MSVTPEHTLVKLVATLQLTLELIDDLQGTTAYKHNLKRQAKLFNDEVEKELNLIYRHLDSDEKEETFMSIQRGIQTVISSSMEELYIKGHRSIGITENEIV
jgi:hypothetical protein